MPAGSFSLCLRALLVCACGPLSFMPTGPCLLCLQALAFYAYRPFLLLLIYIAVMLLMMLCFLELQLDILDITQKSQFIGQLQREIFFIFFTKISDYFRLSNSV